jgi:hypothetical protein
MLKFFRITARKEEIVNCYQSHREIKWNQIKEIEREGNGVKSIK